MKPIQRSWCILCNDRDFQPRLLEFQFERVLDYFLKAESKNSASGLFKKVGVDLKKYPVLQWKWKIENVLRSAQGHQKSGDDYSARIYVAFKYDPSKASTFMHVKYKAAKFMYGEYPPHLVLNYVWDNRLPTGSIFNNPYTDRAKMVVLESGDTKIGKWVLENRNVLEDYRKITGEDPPSIDFIAVMSDTDNTGESVVAYFDDIVFVENNG